MGVSPTFVGRVRRSLEGGEKIARVEKRVGKDRKSRGLPVKKPKIDTANLLPEILELLNGLVALEVMKVFGGEWETPSGRDWRLVRRWVWGRAKRGDIDLGAMPPEEKERLRKLAEQYRYEITEMENEILEMEKWSSQEQSRLVIPEANPNGIVAADNGKVRHSLS